MRPLPLLVFLPTIGLASPFSYSVGNVRIQILSPGLVRLEQRGPSGFEDRKTFSVVNRNLSKVTVSVVNQPNRILLKTPGFVVAVLKDAKSLKEVAVFDVSGKELYQFNGKLPETDYLPAPSKMPQAWTMADNPRLIPPPWGATPAPKNVDRALASKSGWDDRNDAPDIYVFVPWQNGYSELRQDFLRLTGPIPKPPLYVLGFIDSRWFPYTESQALESIDTYRKKRIPLDTFVVDTDWRVNGSAGYDVATKYFPDMARFIQEAHNRHAHLMFNDHPDPKAPTAFDPKELEFRWNGLDKLLALGMDIWWYDRNWTTSLHEPMPGIRKEVWGQRLYHDMTEKARPTERPWIMANAQGIDNGIANYAPHPAGHRYPMMWTGDTGSEFSYLKRGVQNGVDRGVLALQPYTHEDLGGHTGPTPSPELYIRYLQYGCLSPITRVHCTLGQDRHPWAFGDEAEKIVTDYIKLRYRLLPTLYSAAQKATDDGTPLLSRCDLYWPTFPEAAQNDQYLLADNLLVAPITASVDGELKPIPNSFFRTEDGLPGLRGEYFDNEMLKGTPKVVRTEDKIDFNWSGHQPFDKIPQTNFSARWSGTLGPVPSTGKYRLVTRNDDGVRLYIDGKLVLDDWKPEDGTTHEVAVTLEQGSTHKITLEYMQLGGDALCTLGWYPPSTQPDTLSHRTVWIPPGVWQNLWTGETVKGPQTTSVAATLSQTPMWVAAGGIVLTGPEIQYTGEKALDPITADVYLGGRVINNRELDEDDGISTAYEQGAVARTSISLIGDERQATVWLGATRGGYRGIKNERNWVVRLHLPKGQTADKITLDNSPITFSIEQTHAVSMPFEPGQAPQEGQVITIKVPTSSIRKEHALRLVIKK